MNARIAFCLVAAFLVFLSVSSYGKPAPKKKAPQLTAGTKEIAEEMKVTGQTRTLNMLLVLKNKRDRINFINVRRNFRGEILDTQY